MKSFISILYVLLVMPAIVIGFLFGLIYDAFIDGWDYAEDALGYLYEEDF